MEELLISPALPHPQPTSADWRTPECPPRAQPWLFNLLCISPAIKKILKKPTQEMYFKPVLHTHACPKSGMATELILYSKKKFWSDLGLHILFRKAWKILFSEFPWLKYEIVLTLPGTFFFPRKKWFQETNFFKLLLKSTLLHLKWWLTPFLK